jgi:ubiquinone/menaquinone biosynthesis C-methylase UbiE
MSDNIPGYNPISDIGLGFNNFLQYADIKNNDSVLNVGCGTGDDSFAIRRIVGEKGRVIGVDYSLEHIKTSRQSCGNLGYNNVTFFL